MCRRRGLQESGQPQETSTNKKIGRTKLALREGLEQLEQAVLASVEDLRGLGNIDRAHLERAEREVREEVFNVGPRELHGRRRVVVERDAGERLEPVREELGDAGHVHVRLDERVIEALVRDVDLRDPEHVVNVGHDAVATAGHEDDGRVARTRRVVNAGLDDLDHGRVLREVLHGHKLVNLAGRVRSCQREPCRVRLHRAVHEHEPGNVRVRDGKRGERLRAVVQEGRLSVVEVLGLEAVDDINQPGRAYVRLLVDEAVEAHIPGLAGEVRVGRDEERGLRDVREVAVLDVQLLLDVLQAGPGAENGCICESASRWPAAEASQTHWAEHRRSCSWRKKRARRPRRGARKALWA
jgi:hypothetical protein